MPNPIIPLRVPSTVVDVLIPYMTEWLEDESRSHDLTGFSNVRVISLFLEVYLKQLYVRDVGSAIDRIIPDTSKEILIDNARAAARAENEVPWAP